MALQQKPSVFNIYINIETHIWKRQKQHFEEALQEMRGRGAWRKLEKMGETCSIKESFKDVVVGGSRQRGMV